MARLCTHTRQLTATLVLAAAESPMSSPRSVIETTPWTSSSHTHLHQPSRSETSQRTKPEFSGAIGWTRHSHLARGQGVFPYILAGSQQPSQDTAVGLRETNNRSLIDASHEYWLHVSQDRLSALLGHGGSLAKSWLDASFIPEIPSPLRREILRLAARAVNYGRELHCHLAWGADSTSFSNVMGPLPLAAKPWVLVRSRGILSPRTRLRVISKLAGLADVQCTDWGAI